jgi:hypothetical protein
MADKAIVSMHPTTTLESFNLEHTVSSSKTTVLFGLIAAVL